MYLLISYYLNGSVIPGLGKFVMAKFPSRRQFAGVLKDGGHVYDIASVFDCGQQVTVGEYVVGLDVVDQDDGGLKLVLEVDVNGKEIGRAMAESTSRNIGFENASISLYLYQSQ